MSLRKDPRVFTATLRNLKLHAWGKDQVCRETFMIAVYQVSCRPERWAARPQIATRGRKWEGPSAEAVIDLVTEDFEEILQPWFQQPMPASATPSLRAATDISTGRKQA